MFWLPWKWVKVALIEIANLMFFQVNKLQFASVVLGEISSWELSTNVVLLVSKIKLCGPVRRRVAMAKLKQ